MAKKPTEIHERFKISAELEATALGPVVAQFARMGLSNINYELITDVVTFRQNAPRGAASDVSGPDFLAEWTKKHPIFTSGEVVKHFMENGRTMGSGRMSLRVLAKRKVIAKIGEGNWRRADVKASGVAPLNKGTRREIGAVDLARKFIRNRETFNTKQLKALFEKNGRPPTSAHQTIHQLKANDEIAPAGEIGTGDYVVVKKAAAKTNGAGEAAHG